MNWEQLLSLKRQGDTSKRLRIEQDDTRLGFEVDYDRIIFSAAFRSLQDKTQVIPLSKTDFVHTRLTHSLEVSVVGRSLGRLVGKKIIEKYRIDLSVGESIIYIKKEKVYTKSSAALWIANEIKFPANLISGLIIFPPMIRDFTYDFIAKNRYKWFGKSETCLLPDPEQRNRFIDL
jgi:predicted DCC family thiol-disulfide oxidoreductase YuxK